MHSCVGALSLSVYLFVAVFIRLSSSVVPLMVLKPNTSEKKSFLISSRTSGTQGWPWSARTTDKLVYSNLWEMVDVLGWWWVYWDGGGCTGMVVGVLGWWQVIISTCNVIKS